jgi:hypothetical protein
VPWPAELEPIFVNREEQLVTVLGELAFYGNGRAWIQGRAEPTAAASPVECAVLVKRILRGTSRGIAIGFDGGTAGADVACIARAAEEAYRASPQKRNGSVDFLVELHSGLEATSRVVTLAVRPSAIALSASEVPPRASRLHLARAHVWRYRPDGANEESGTGPVLASISPSGEVLLTFDPDVTASDLIQTIAALNAKVTLGLGDPLSFEAAPPAWHARVQVDSAQGVSRASAQALLEARRPALEHCQVDAARALPAARFDVMADGSLRAAGPPPSADDLATCVRVALLGTVLPRPKRPAYVVVTVEFAR